MNVTGHRIFNPVVAADTKFEDVQTAKKDAFLTLESLVLYKKNDSGQWGDFFPAPRKILRSGSRIAVVIGDMPFPDNVPHPENSLTALYGFRDSLEEFQKHLRFARENSMSSVKITFRVPVRTIIMGTTDLAKLPTTDFLNLRRLQSDLSDMIVDGVNERLSEEKNQNKTVVSDDFFSKISEACRRPDLVCDVIRSKDIFKHIKAVAYMIPDETNSARGRQVATVFTDQLEEATFRGDMPFDIVLPDHETLFLNKLDRLQLA